MPITGRGWEILISRTGLQTRGTRTRTVGTYQVYHDGQPAAPIQVGEFLVQLSGTTAEACNPSQNDAPANEAHPSRILPKRYRLQTSGGPMYKTIGYRNDLQIAESMPGIELLRADTGNRTDILIHPGKNAFLSSIGCINLCTRLPDGNENIDYPGSRRRVIALIDDMRRFLGALPGPDQLIANAFAVIDGDPLPVIQPAAAAGGTIDGNVLAQQHNVGVKNAGVKISALDARMAPVIGAVAQAAQTLGLPRPVITSGNDSNHMQGSLHYLNRALDFRANNITLAQGERLDAEVSRLLGDAFDVIFETFPNPSNNHLHVEYDP